MKTSLSSENIKNIDRSNMFALLCSYPKEIQDARDLGESFELKGSFDDLQKIVVIGMGGSAIGGDLLRFYVNDSCRVPILVNRSYNLPKFVDSKTLVFACSFSGKTEETLTVTKKLKETGARVICITSGGDLEAMAHKSNYSIINIPNGRQPRTALCYLFLPMIVALERVGLISSRAFEFEETVQVLTEFIQNVQKDNSLSMQIAHKLYQKLPIIYTSDKMEAVAMRWRCQFSENSQTLAFSNILPEMNHNEIMGWDPCTCILDDVHVVFLRDREELPRIKHRFGITKKIIQKHNSDFSEVYSEGISLLARMFSLIALGDFTSYYLAILNNVDPTAIENINFLKQELSKLPV